MEQSMEEKEKGMTEDKYYIGKTDSGFEYKIPKYMVKDFKLGSDIRKYQRTQDTMIIFDIIERLLGEEQEDALCDHVADDTGYVDAEKVATEVTEIFNAISENLDVKNS